MDHRASVERPLEVVDSREYFQHCPMVNVGFRSLYNIILVIVKGEMRKM